MTIGSEIGSSVYQRKCRQFGHWKEIMGFLGYVASLVAALFSCYALAQDAPAAAYGPNDRLGALNNLSAEVVTQAAGLVKKGKVYSLAFETKPHETQIGFRYYRPIIQPITSGSNELIAFEDTIMLSPGLGTTMDGLGHGVRNGVHYNGVRAEEVYGLNGAKTFSIDTLPPIVTRGVLLDVTRYRGEAAVQNGTVIGPAVIEAVAKAQGVTIRRGDVVLLHTGWSQSAQDVRLERGNPILGEEGARYLAKLGVVAVGVNLGPDLAVHQILLVDYGVYILEGVKTNELASDRSYEFLFVAAAPRLVGTVQGIMHPVAIR